MVAEIDYSLILMGSSAKCSLANNVYHQFKKIKIDFALLQTDFA